MKLEGEIWRDIEGYKGLYKVSNYGRVYSLSKSWISANGAVHMHNGKILSQGVTTSGYNNVNLYKNNKRSSKLVHRLVIIEFVGKSNLPVDHINEIKTDNRLCNLRYLDHRANSSRSKKNGSSKYTGFCWRKYNKKWSSRIIINKKRYYLGSYTNEQDAGEAYRKALNNWNKYKICPI